MKFFLLLLTVIVFAASSGFAVAAPDAGAPALKRGITNDQKKPSTHDVNKSGAYKKNGDSQGAKNKRHPNARAGKADLSPF